MIRAQIIYTLFVTGMKYIGQLFSVITAAPLYGAEISHINDFKINFNALYEIYDLKVSKLNCYKNRF